MQEKLKHTEAFEYYYSLGDKRNYQKVADKFQVSHTSIRKWSKNFNWKERIQQRDFQNAKELKKKTDKAIISEKANYRKIIKGAIGQFVKKLQSGEIEIKNVQDLEKLVKLDMLLMGEDTEKQGGEGTTIKIRLSGDEDDGSDS